MADAALKEATYADLEAVPPHLVAELIYGSLVTHPRPSPRHGVAASLLGMELGNTFQRGRGGPGGWIFIDEPELHFGRNVVVPDIAGWRRERMSSLPKTNFFETPPDWVCEILSPSTEAWDRGAKRQIYAEAGVPYLWLVNPTLRQLEAFQLAGAAWMLTGVVNDAEDVHLPPFEAAPFSLGLLWPFDEPNDAGASPQS